jgi:AcrR family transcriptional regulator
MHPVGSAAESGEIGGVLPFVPGSLYYRFKDNQPLVLAVLDLLEETWSQEVASIVDRESDPVAALMALAHGHAIFCRQDLARVTMALRLDFAAQDDPVARRLERISEGLVQRCSRLITAARRMGSVPEGPPTQAVGLAFIGAIEGAVIELTGQAPHDEALAARAAAGVLGLDQEAIR